MFVSIDGDIHDAPSTSSGIVHEEMDVEVEASSTGYDEPSGDENDTNDHAGNWNPYVAATS